MNDTVIDRMSPCDREEAAALWREIFGDSEAFTNWFFQERFCPEYSCAAYHEGRIVAMTLGRPTEILVEGKVHKALLISGVSTRPEYRKRGLMNLTMHLQIYYARKSGFSCCYLYPDIETLYASLGFRNGTDALVIRSDANRWHALFSLREGAEILAMRAVYDAICKSHDGMQIRDEEKFAAVLRDYSSDGGTCAVAYDGETPVGYICTLADGTVSELFALCPDAYAFLLDTTAARFGRSLEASAPSDCGLAGKRVYGMHYLVFNDAFSLPLKNGYCATPY